MTLTNEQIAMLNEKLDLAKVKKPSGKFGPKGDYLEGWHVINELNRTFGSGGWSDEINLVKDSVTLEKDKDGNPQWQASYTCICTLTAAGVVKQDVGFGSGFAKFIGDAIEGATKEATTDALKRAARKFGNVFGLALYDKSRENVEEKMSPELTALLDELHQVTELDKCKPFLDSKKDIRAKLLEHESIAFNTAYTQHKATLKPKDDDPISDQQAAILQIRTLSETAKVAVADIFKKYSVMALNELTLDQANDCIDALKAKIEKESK